MKKYALISLLLLPVLLFFTINTGDRQQLSVPITIAVSKTPLCAPLYIAEEKGFFKKQGVNVVLSEVIGGYRSFIEVMEGKADLGTSSESVLMFASLRKQSYINLGTFVKSDNDIKLLAHSSTQIENLHDIKQHNIGVIKNTASEYFLSIILALSGVEQSQVKLTAIAPDKMPEALQAGELDAIAVWEPYAFKTLQLLKNQTRVLSTKNLYTLSFNLISTEQTVKIKREEISRVMQAIDEAIDYITSHPVEAQSILKQRLELDEQFIDWIWPDYIFKLSLSRSLIFTMENEAHWAIQNELTDMTEIPEFLDNIDKTILQSMKPEVVTL